MLPNPYANPANIKPYVWFFSHRFTVNLQNRDALTEISTMGFLTKPTWDLGKSSYRSGMGEVYLWDSNANSCSAGFGAVYHADLGEIRCSGTL